MKMTAGCTKCIINAHPGKVVLVTSEGCCVHCGTPLRERAGHCVLRPRVLGWAIGNFEEMERIAHEAA